MLGDSSEVRPNPALAVQTAFQPPHVATYVAARRAADIHELCTCTMMQHRHQRVAECIGRQGTWLAKATRCQPVGWHLLGSSFLPPRHALLAWLLQQPAAAQPTKQQSARQPTGSSRQRHSRSRSNQQRAHAADQTAASSMTGAGV